MYGAKSRNLTGKQPVHKIHNKIDMLCMWKKKGEIIWIRHI